MIGFARDVRRQGALAPAAALGAFAAGLLVYMFDRPPHTAYLLPAWLASPGGTPLFGALGGSLPSFAHALAFSVGTAMLPRWRSPGAACLLWGGIDAAFEIGQHAALSGAVSTSLPAWFARWPVLDHLGASLLRGRFDTLDLAAIVGGCTAARGLLAVRATRQEVRS